MKEKLRFMMIGAHPDDCDISSGGIAVKVRKLGHLVKFVSATNGDTGHHEKGGGPLAAIRAKEAENAGKTAGIEYKVLDIHNNGIESGMQTRERIISLIREFKPDVVFTHRPYDYHPDHRITSMLVQDSSYALIIPNVCPLTPPLKHMPVIMYFSDNFKRPYEFAPDIIVDIDDVFEEKVRMIDCHKSQVYEWIPWTNGVLSKVPEDNIKRLKWLFDRQTEIDLKVADIFRQKLIERYGREAGEGIKCAEAFEISEYGRQVTTEELNCIFSF